MEFGKIQTTAETSSQVNSFIHLLCEALLLSALTNMRSRLIRHVYDFLETYLMPG